MPKLPFEHASRNDCLVIVISVLLVPLSVEPAADVLPVVLPASPLELPDVVPPEAVPPVVEPPVPEADPDVLPPLESLLEPPVPDAVPEVVPPDDEPLLEPPVPELDPCVDPVVIIVI
jgi:hypothetical protein